MLSRYWIHELTRPAFEEWLENEPAPVIIIGIGSIEQHGPHLPLGTDSLTIREIIQAVAERSNSNLGTPPSAGTMYSLRAPCLLSLYTSDSPSGLQETPGIDDNILLQIRDAAPPLRDTFLS